MPLDQTRTTELPLIRTKISMPRISLEFVHRPRLTELIERGVLGPLTLLAAPAGYGKTNLMIEWATETHLPAAWLNIDNEDNDISRFFRYLLGALQTVEPGLGEDALDFLQSAKGGGVSVGLTLLVNEISVLQKELVLVLDDFQALDDVLILQSIGFLLKHLPQNLHLVIASRSEPALDLALFRAKGRVIELGAADLRFTGEEVGLFFQQAMRLELPAEVIQTLEKRTAGWITALQMAAVSLRHQADPATLLANLEGDAHFLVDFLAEEVLDRQPEEIRLFLLRSAILDTLSGPLCEAVVNPEAQPGYGMVMLNRLEHANLFISALDEKHEWFRYHNLFTDFLRHIQAEINPAEIPVLQKRAALWFEQNAGLNEAFQYGLASGDMEWTANLIERNTQKMIKTGEVFTLTRWIGKLPDTVIHQRPRLGLTYAWGLIAAYQLDLARYWLDDTRQSLDQIEKQTETAAGSAAAASQESENSGLWNMRGGLAVCQSSLAMLNGDVEQAASFSTQATSFLQEENPFIHSLLALEGSLYYILSGDTQAAIDSLRDTVRIARQANNLLVMIIATCEIADIQVIQGQLSQALVTLQKAQYMVIGPEGEPLPMAGLVDVGFGEILLERGSLEEAHTYIERGCRMSQSLWPISSMDGMISLARLHQARGEIADCKAIIAEASRMALSTESSQWDDTIISGVAIRMALQRDDLSEAEQWRSRGGFPDLSDAIALERYPYHIFEYMQLTKARFLMVRGQDTGRIDYLQQALELLDTLQLEAERLQRVTSKIEIFILRAIIQFTLGDDRASSTLLEALAMGEPEGYCRIFLDEGWRLTELLRQCQSTQRDSDSYLPSAAFIERLLNASANTPGSRKAARLIEQRTSPTNGKTDDGLLITLSAREMEVLTLIAEGKTNQEISAQLYLALNTVKRHAYNIYAKLDVKKRTQAVSRARQLGLIP